jgi:3-deoxy-D-manno-octulosonate 8-phosphate phosphatase (KDO 8-P phosphatase)
MQYPTQALNLAKQIKLLILDVDGVLTPGHVMLTEEGTEIKMFNVQDGYGIKNIQRHGIQIAIISGRNSQACSKRMQDLGIKHVHQGIKEKLPIFEQLLKDLSLTPEDCAYMGDDVPDVPIMRQVALRIAVANATQPVKNIANWHTTRNGGYGAVRETCDLLMTAQNLPQDYIA